MESREEVPRGVQEGKRNNCVRRNWSNFVLALLALNLMRFESIKILIRRKGGFFFDVDFGR